MKRLFSIYFFVFITSFLIQGQEVADPCKKSTEGKDFWFGFMESRNYHNAHYLEITITARENTFFSIYTGKEETLFGNYNVSANSSVQIKMEPWDLAEATGSEIIQNRGIHLVSEKPVNVYALNWDRNSADVAVIFPSESLGNEYFAMCYEPHIHDRDGDYGNGRNSQFLAVAKEDSTRILIIPSKKTDKLVDAGDSIFVTLNKGEVYQVQSLNFENLPGQGDLTGSYLVSNKPFAFYSGSLATTVPATSGISAWDHLYEQIPPIHSWGREYYAVPLKSREQDVYRIMAANDNTIVHVTGRPDIILGRGEYKEIVLFHNQPSRIFADKPIMVAQFSQSQSVDRDYTGGNGDPFMIILSSTTQAKNDVTFVAYNSDQIVKYFVNIISLTSEVENIRFNGTSISSEFKKFPDGKYSYAQKVISAGNYRINNIDPERGFLAYVYGYGGVESYGYGVGFNLDLVLDLGESINFSGDTLLLCYGEKIKLDAGPYFDTYNWNTGDSTQTLEVDLGGEYKVNTTTINGCNLEDSIYIFVSHPETKLDKNYDEGCAPYSMVLEAEDGFDRYLWQNENNDSLSTDQAIRANRTGEYRLTVYNEYNCPARDTMNFVVFPVPKINIEGEELVCGAKQTNLLVEITQAPEPVWNYPTSFTWSSNSSLVTFDNVAHQNATIEAPDWGEYEIYYSLVTSDGCFVSDTFNIQFQPVPTSSFKFV
ncbi:MAG TPA: IgGFc-binding protein, partial [Prolixibacteraceae bacterium]|nr:IgGFc-binding protein [Prolixibacteraceae bacterium]